MNAGHTAAIILAAGEGTRLAAKRKNKVSFHLNGRPMITYPVETLQACGITDIVVVVKFAKSSVERALGDRVRYVVQGDRRGTAAALSDGLTLVGSPIQDVIVIYGDDSAFYTPELISKLLQSHRSTQVDLTFLSLTLENPAGLGRVLRDDQQRLLGIVEEKNASESQKAIKEVNAGFYCFSLPFVRRYLPMIERDLRSGEYYLTDIVEIALTNRQNVNVYVHPDNSIWFGVNTREQLRKARMLKQTL